MESIYDLLRKFYGRDYLPSFGGGYKSPRKEGKHQASKRGYKHKHNPSKGQRKNWGAS